MLRKIIDWIDSKIRIDHQRHFFYSFFFTKLLMLILPWWIAGLVVLFVGLYKEVNDCEFDRKDVEFNILGIIIAVIT